MTDANTARAEPTFAGLHSLALLFAPGSDPDECKPTAANAIRADIGTTAHDSGYRVLRSAR